MTLLNICQKAARKLSIAVPSAITSATSNKDAMLLLELAQEEGFLLARRANWSALRKEHTFTSVAADSQTLSIPSDYSFVVADTMYDRTLRREVPGPITPQQWQHYKANLIVPSTWHFIRRGSTFLFTSSPTAGNTIAYEYISTNWARSADGDEQAEFEADTDTHIWSNDEILKLAVIWRWKQHKGLAFEDDRMAYERVVADEIMRDNGLPTIRTGGNRLGRGKAGMADYNTIPTS